MSLGTRMVGLAWVWGLEVLSNTQILNNSPNQMGQPYVRVCTGLLAKHFSISEILCIHVQAQIVQLWQTRALPSSRLQRMFLSSSLMQ